MRLLLAALLALSLTLHAEDNDLRRELEHTYSTWRSALAAHDLAGWRRATAPYRQALTRNLIISQKQLFPDALFAIPMRPPETSTLHMVKVEAKGATAHLVFFGKVDLGLTEASEVPENLLILKFIKDKDTWKFDTTRIINLTGAPEIRAELKNNGTSPYLNEPELNPTGIVPATPAPCSVPDRIGVLQIASVGYETRAIVNGFEIATVTDNLEQHLVIGGLKDGENPIKLQIKPTTLPEDVPRQLEINALVLTGDEAKPTIRVYTWKPEGTTAPDALEQVIHVNKLTLRGL